MKMEIGFLGFLIAVGVSFFFLYTRKKEWSKPNRRWLFCFALFVFGVLGFIILEDKSPQSVMLYWGFCVPVFYYSLDRFFRYLSFKIYKRDFILWLRGSSEINDSVFGKKSHVKALDILFSMVLLFFIPFATILGWIFLF